MNTSINYSGFVDLLGNSASENISETDQEEDSKQEPAVELTVKQFPGVRHTRAEVSCPDR